MFAIRVSNLWHILVSLKKNSGLFEDFNIIFFLRR